MFLVETEFLLGLRPSDKWNNLVKEIISLSKMKNVPINYTLSSLLEIRSILYSHGKKAGFVHRAIAHLKAKLDEEGIVEVPLTSDDIILADKLREETEATYFDVLHAAVALRTSLTLISNDPVFRSLGVKCLTMKEVIEHLR
ncbi:MAG: PIN domain-containing protein [Candidatus Baldrarchaeota archaeon]|nr:PIN domain-containing protein [Candidatus Baldrarchaeota archaeon]